MMTTFRFFDDFGRLDFSVLYMYCVYRIQAWGEWSEVRESVYHVGWLERVQKGCRDEFILDGY
jgi:hypothetical protein